MAQITDVVSVERKRGNEQEKRQIHLFLEGKFYRAYAWFEYYHSEVEKLILKFRSDNV